MLHRTPTIQKTKNGPKNAQNGCSYCNGSGVALSNHHSDQSILCILPCPSHHCPYVSKYFKTINSCISHQLDTDPVKYALDLAMTCTTSSGQELKDWGSKLYAAKPPKQPQKWFKSQTFFKNYPHLDQDLIRKFREMKKQSEDGRVVVHTDKGLTVCSSLEELDNLISIIKDLELQPKSEPNVIPFPIERRLMEDQQDEE